MKQGHCFFGSIGTENTRSSRISFLSLFYYLSDILNVYFKIELLSTDIFGDWKRCCARCRKWRLRREIAEHSLPLTNDISWINFQLHWRTKFNTGFDYFIKLLKWIETVTVIHFYKKVILLIYYIYHPI